MIDPAIGAALAAAFALLFAGAALHKLRDLATFAQILAAYRVLPGAARIAWAVPLAELLLAAALLVPALRARAAAAGALLLVGYALAIMLNLARGRRELSCGCGGADERRPIAPWMVVRNLLLAGALAALLLPSARRALEAVDLLTIAAGVTVSALLYMCADGLLGRLAPRTARWQAQ